MCLRSVGRERFGVEGGDDVVVEEREGDAGAVDRMGAREAETIADQRVGLGAAQADLGRNTPVEGLSADPEYRRGRNRRAAVDADAGAVQRQVEDAARDAAEDAIQFGVES